MFDWLPEFVRNLLLWFADFVYTGIGWIIDLFFDISVFIIQGVLSLITLPGQLAFGAALWAGLPTNVVWLLDVLGFATIVNIIGGAYLVRFLLNLIPSWATRA